MTDSPIDLFPHLFEGTALIRRITRNGDPWFIAVDVCRTIHIKDTNKAVQVLDEDEKDTAICRTLGGPQELIVISESGLYALVLRSHAAMRAGTVAHRFRKWVTADLLPSIRKTGSYGTAPRERTLREEIDMVNVYIRAGGPRAGAELILKFGWPDVPALHLVMRQGVMNFIRTIDAVPATPDEPLN